MRRVTIGTEFDISVRIDGDEPGPGTSVAKQRPRQIAVGREFDANVTLTGDTAETTDALTRSSIVKAVAVLAGVFLLGAASLGLVSGDFKALQSVWSVVGPLYGGIASYFFVRSK